jgi:hypothetical protein
MNLSQCGNSRSRSFAQGHELPRRLQFAASALPPKAAAAVANRRGSQGPCVDGSELARRISRRKLDRCSHVFGL